MAQVEPCHEYTKLQITKNLLILSFTYLASFSAIEGLAFLQSTINKEIGVVCLAAQYACGCIAALLLPKYLIQKFGSKTTIVVSIFLYVPYLASNYYPYVALMLPASFIVGFGSTLIWNAASTYLNDISILYSSKETTDETQMPSSSPYDLYNTIAKSQNLVFYTCQSRSGETPIVRIASVNPEEPILHKIIKSDQHIKENKGSCENTISTKNDNLNDEVSMNENKNDFFDIMIKDSFYDCARRSNDFSDILYDECDSRRCSSSYLIDGAIPEENQHDFGTFHQNDYKRDSLKAKANSKILESTTARFFGFFGFIYQTSHIWSNVISYFVLMPKEDDFIRNSSCVCGAEFCDINTECFVHNLQMPSNEVRYILTSVYVSLCLLSALIIIFFLDDIRLVKREVTFSLDITLATLKFQGNKNQIFLIPLSIYLGLLQGFLTGDFTKDFIGCAWGINHVPLVVLSMGCMLSFSCCLFGILEKYLGRCIILAGTAALSYFAGIMMLKWIPSAEEPTMMFVVAGIWGAQIGIAWCGIRAFIGIIFKEDEEVAFGSYQLWHALGCALSFSYSNYICSYVKIYLLLLTSAAGYIGYFCAEWNFYASQN